MKVKNWFILAGGSATRWQGYQGVKNKCFVKIDGERLREDWQIGEDLDWLKRVLPGKRKKFSDKIVYTYDWNANPDSLSKRHNRGELPLERQNV